MARNDTIRGADENVTRGRWFRVKDIGTISSNLTGLESVGHILSVDEFSASAVEDDHLVTHLSDFGGINHILCFLVEETMK
jgi:hypothetical protein